MVARAGELKLAGLGIADRNSLAGVVRAHVFARENRAALGNMRVVVGARLVFRDGSPDMLAYPRDRAAYGRLCRLLTTGNLRAPKGQCWLDLADLLAFGEGLQIIVAAARQARRACPGSRTLSATRLLDRREPRPMAPTCAPRSPGRRRWRASSARRFWPSTTR